MAEEKYIQLVANYDDWVSIKKLKIEQSTDPRTILEFLASLSVGIDRKVEENLGKIVKLDELEKALDEVFSVGKGASGINEALAAAKGPKINSVITQLSEIPSLQKGEQKEMQDFCKAFIMRKALRKCNLLIDYSEVEIPGMKRLMKKKG